MTWKSVRLRPFWVQRPQGQRLDDDIALVINVKAPRPIAATTGQGIELSQGPVGRVLSDQ
jgi:hypothetical protein